MARDYAKAKKKKPARRKTKPSKKTSPGSGLKIYFAGVLSGVFICFLAYLTTLQRTEAPTQPQLTAAPDAAQEEEAPPKPRFDFYTLLPTQTIDVEVEPEPSRDLGGQASAATVSHTYVLQAGSFRQREDADRRRAELLLLGLEPTIQESDGENGRWFRVYLGPFSSSSAMNRARGLTASQDIDTLPLKRSIP
jgi:cell division protein FtsN